MKKKHRHTTLKRHARVRTKLVPPLNRLPSPMHFSSWVDERLPDVLWLAIIRCSMDQDSALSLYRQFLHGFAYSGPLSPPIPTHTFLSQLSGAEFDRYMAPIISRTDLCKQFGAMLSFDSLPDRQHWIRHALIADDSFSVLSKAIFSCLDHQSQESTDIRWFSITCMARNDKIVFPDNEHFRERLREYDRYPHYGDQRSVRPSIRAMEIAFRRDKDEPVPKWCSDFWRECWQKYLCIPGERSIAAKKAENLRSDPTAFARRTQEIFEALMEHFHETAENTHLDARHDSAFGLVFYGLYLTFECLVTRAFERAIGHVIVRTLAEVVLTLGFLRKAESQKLWAEYRNYGIGQIKLSFLKLLEEGDVPQFINMDFFEHLINEDFWHEHIDINLGHWAGKDLRSLAIEAGMKDIYDKYYTTTSPFVHGTWGAVRMTAFETCLNPLHRFHRIPCAPTQNFPSCASDLKKLSNVLLEHLGGLFPEFKLRFADEDLAGI